MKVPAGSQSGTILRLRGEGFPNVHGYGQGDQLVKMMVEVPKKLNREQQKLMAGLAETERKHVGPRKKEYMKKLRKYGQQKESGSK